MQGMSATELVVPHSPLSPTLQRGKMHHIWRSDIVDTADLKKTTCLLISFYSCIQYMHFLKIALHALLESEKEHNNHQRDKHYSLWLQLCKHSHWKIIHIWSHIQSPKQNAITTPASFTASGWPLSALCISGITLCKNHRTLTVKVSNYICHQNFPQRNSWILKKLRAERGDVIPASSPGPCTHAPHSIVSALTVSNEMWQA